MNRVRGPFNVSLPAQAAGVAALEDVDARRAGARAQRVPGCPGWSASSAHWACASTRASATSFWSSSRTVPGATPLRPTPTSRPRASIPRQMGAYGLPDCLRISIGPRGGEPAPGRGAGRLRWRATARMTPFRRVAMLGIGLINGSLARRAAPRGGGRRDRGLRPSGATPAPARSSSACATVPRPTRPPRSRGADLVVLGVPPAAVGPVWPRRCGPGLPPRRHRHRRQLDQGAGRARRRPASADAQPVRAGPSGRRHRAFRPGCRLRHPVRAPPLHPDPDRGHRPAGGRARAGACGSSPARPST